MIRVKICGITNAEDAACAVEAGAHALGFVFYEKSSRHVLLKTAANICASLPPFVSKVGVFVNELERTIEKAAAECGLDTLQFHGDEPPVFCQKFLPKVVKAFRLRSRDDLRALSDYDVDAWLLDAYSPPSHPSKGGFALNQGDSSRSEEGWGGTGKRCDWDLAVEAGKLGRPIILSGGLAPDNVAEAIRKVRPFGVDVSSGVEKSPGQKDPVKIHAFLQACREAE